MANVSGIVHAYPILHFSNHNILTVTSEVIIKGIFNLTLLELLINKSPFSLPHITHVNSRKEFSINRESSKL